MNGAEIASVGLTPPQLRALECVLSGDTFGKTAKVVGVPLRTLYNWVRLPEFQAQLRAFRNSVVGHARTKLALLANGAVRAYEECLEAEYMPELTDMEARRVLTAQSVRVQVASQVLDRLGVTAERAAEDVLAGNRSPAELEAALRARGWRHVNDPLDGPA